MGATAIAIANSYAGDISPEGAWQALESDARTVLVDVRTPPEWQFVGLPDISSTKGRLVTVPWKNYPSFALNTEFAAQLQAERVLPGMQLFFLCRSGGRSLDAAIAMTQLGFGPCYNVAGGFEGEPDASRHRGITGGWKAAGLPWAQN